MEERSINPNGVVAAIDVGWVNLARDETAVDPGSPAACPFQRNQHTAAAIEQMQTPRRRSKDGFDLRPGRGPLTRWQATIYERRDHQHNIPVVLRVSRCRRRVPVAEDDGHRLVPSDMGLASPG